jgi:hypothetical protein
MSFIGGARGKPRWGAHLLGSARIWDPGDRGSGTGDRAECLLGDFAKLQLNAFGAPDQGGGTAERGHHAEALVLPKWVRCLDEEGVTSARGPCPAVPQRMFQAVTKAKSRDALRMTCVARGEVAQFPEFCR